MSVIQGRGYRRRREEPEAVEQAEREASNEIAETVEEVSENAQESPESVGLDKAREESRKTYLRRRLELRLGQLQRDIEELSSRHLTPKEAQEYRDKVTLLESIKQEHNISEEFFILDDSSTNSQKKKELLADRSESKRRRFENSWELKQLRRAQPQHNPDDIVIANLKAYEYVFDESQFVDFEQNEELDGNDEPETHNHAAMAAVRKSLPVYKLRNEFLQAIRENQVLVVVGETGSGKTTQLPQYLYEDGYTKAAGKKMKVCCTQPRRVAATSVATRVAEEVGCKVGTTVGYSIRFEDVTTEETEIKYTTDGLLLREFLNDPLLLSYSAIMIDEAHERTVLTEIVLSLLKDIIKERTDLKLIVASATINAEKFSEYFDKAPIFKIPGRRFPVDVAYTKSPEANYIQAAITTVFQIHLTQEPGDILVFLTGQDEIELVEETLKDASEKLGDLADPLLIAPIYANLPPQQQRMIFEPTPPKTRKVVLATNIAETSITIDGIRYVVDTGYVKENVFSPATGMESLVVVPCSRASADQRAGRAGRVGPGKCYRLYTKWSFYNELEANPTPEILRVNLATIVLLLLSMGITDLVHFDFMDPPSLQALIKSLELLYALGALDGKGELTSDGRKMAEFPMDPMFCKCLLAGDQFGVIEEIMTIIAMLSESSSLFYRPKDKKEQADKQRAAFEHEAGDHFSLLNVWNEWMSTGFSNIWCEDHFLQYKTLKRIKEVRTQLEHLCRRVGIIGKSVDLGVDEMLERMQRALVSGFFPNAARLSKTGSSYCLLKDNHTVYIHPLLCLFKAKPPPRYVLYHELVLTSKEYMRSCMRLDPKMLELAAHFYPKHDESQA